MQDDLCLLSTILYYTILYYTILYYTILYYTILYYTILYYTMLYYNRFFGVEFEDAHVSTLWLLHGAKTIPSDVFDGSSGFFLLPDARLELWDIIGCHSTA